MRAQIEHTMNRKIIVAGNWKMNLHYAEGLKLVSALAKQVSSSRSLEVLICPPYPYIIPLVDQLRQENRDISIGAQNCHLAASGAYTGEVSAEMLASCGVKYVIIGHSERRQQFDEKGEVLQQKIDLALKNGLHVVYCIGETLDEREAGREEEIVANQLAEGLGHLTSDQMIYLTVAYEPVWAIGTGKTASPKQAQEMHAFIRAQLVKMFDDDVAVRTSLLYGGSVKPVNAAEIFGQADVDGGLIGGASLDEHQFIAIVRAAQSNL